MVMVTDLSAILLNSSSIRVTWKLENDQLEYLNGKFRTFAVTIYENFSKNFSLNFLKNEIFI